MEQRQIVVVAEDDDELRELLLDALSQEHRRLVSLEDGSELLDYISFLASRGLQHKLPDLILTDVHMPGASGLDVVSWARTCGVDCPFVILTGYAHEQLYEVAAQLGQTKVLSKPQPLEAIRAAANEALATRH